MALCMYAPTLEWEANKAKPPNFLKWFSIWNFKHSQNITDICKHESYLKKFSFTQFSEQAPEVYGPPKQGSKPRKMKA